MSSDIVSISSLFVAALSLYVAWLAFNRDKADLRIKLHLVGKSGLIEKDHIFIVALNVARRPIVLEDVRLDVRLAPRYWFNRPDYEHHHFTDQFGGYTSGGSFGEPQKVEPGFEFKLMLQLSTRILVGHYELKNVYIPDTLGNVFQPGKLQMFLFRREIRRQHPEWRSKLNFDDNSNRSANVEINKVPNEEDT